MLYLVFNSPFDQTKESPMKRILPTMFALLLSISFLSNAVSAAYWNVSWGETLSEKCLQTGISQKSLLEMNSKIVDPDEIYAGDLLFYLTWGDLTDAALYAQSMIGAPGNIEGEDIYYRMIITTVMEGRSIQEVVDKFGAHELLILAAIYSAF